MKKVIFTLLALIIAATGFFGYTIVSDMVAKRASIDSENQNAEGDAQNSDANNEGEKDKEAISGTVSEKEMEEYEEEGKNPFGEDIAIEELEDAQFQEYIHEMSHQKVEAEEKWGFYEINSTRIEWLLEGLDEDLELDHPEVYEDILEKWEDGDFSSVDDDHNAVWELQDGTIGKATGILSEEEEEAFIEENK